VKGISLKGRLSKTRLIGALAVLVLAGGAGGYVLQSGMLDGDHEDGGSADASGVSCTTTEFIKLNRGGQRWLRKYIRTDSADGIERVRTALRVAGVLAKAEKADLYQVVVLDNAGPEGRANLRGAAIGAEVLFAPDPTKLPGMDQPFVARYASGKANAIGLFYGASVELSPDDIRANMTAIKDRSDCETLVADASAPVEGEGLPGHGKPAAGHGEAPEAGQAEGHGKGDGEAQAEDHGDAPAEGHEAASEPAEGHDAAPSASGHDAPAETATASEGGWMSTVMNMIPGMGGTEKTVAGGHEPAAANGEQAGIFTRVMHMIPGLGSDAAPGENSAPSDVAHAADPAQGADQSAPATALADHAAPSPQEAADDHKAAAELAVTAPEDTHAPVADKPEQEAAAPHEIAPEETGATH
jgi:hypothetical protein